VTLASPDNPQRVALAVYEWASNKTALDNAALLMLANRVTPTDRYVEAALDQLHYVLGRNAMSKSYVTGYGQVSVLHPHNRTIFSIGRLVPGVMVGGPNGRAEDGIAPAAEGPRSYVDDQRAYSVNENAIDYNASLVLITGLFQPA
jgi:endoglucanase